MGGIIWVGACLYYGFHINGFANQEYVNSSSNISIHGTLDRAGDAGVRFLEDTPWILLGERHVGDKDTPPTGPTRTNEHILQRYADERPVDTLSPRAMGPRGNLD